MKECNIVIHITANESEKANALFLGLHGMEGFNRLESIIAADTYLKAETTKSNEISALTIQQKKILENADAKITDDKYMVQRALLLLEIAGAKIQDIGHFKEHFCNQDILFKMAKGTSDGYANYVNTKMQEISDMADGDIWYDMKTKKVRMNCFEYMSPSEYEEQNPDEYFADLYVYHGRNITDFSTNEVGAMYTLYKQFPISTEDGIVITFI